MNPQKNPSQPTQNLYSTLSPAQKAQNPSHSHPFPSSQGPQGPQGQGQYIPPAAHGQIQAGSGQQIDVEKVANMNKLKELDKSLGGCGMIFYKIWLLLVIVFSCMGVYLNFESFLRERNSWLSAYSKAMDLSWFAFSIGSLIRSVLGFLGGYKKNLTTVNMAFWMTIVNLLLSTGAFIAMFVLIKEQNKYMGESYGNWIYDSVDNGEFVLVFGSFDLVYFILEMIGMGRLRKILMEREIAKASMDEVNDSFNKI